MAKSANTAQKWPAPAGEDIGDDLNANGLGMNMQSRSAYNKFKGRARQNAGLARQTFPGQAEEIPDNSMPFEPARSAADAFPHLKSPSAL